MSASKTFAVRSSATRAAKQAGLTPDQYVIMEDAGRFSYHVLEDAPEVVVPTMGEEAESTLAGLNFEEAELRVAGTAPIGSEIVGDVHDYLCPHCGIRLQNGIGNHGQEVNGKFIKHEKYELVCLACDGEFGPAIHVASDQVEQTTAAKHTEKKDHSTATRPCKKVWFIADDMIAVNPSIKRKEILEACVAAGVAFYTARTQYQQWLSVRKEMAAREAAAK